MTFDQIMAALGVIIPLVTAMGAMHVQNLLRGDRVYRMVADLQASLETHARKTKKMRKRLIAIEMEVKRHETIRSDPSASSLSKRIN